MSCAPRPPCHPVVLAHRADPTLQDVLSDLDLAASLVRGAGLQAAAMRRIGLSTTRKTSASDVVSDADHAAEQLIVDRLREARPGDGIVGEEGTSLSGTRTWFVDPVDGTYNFVSGLPFWCSAVALVDDEGPLLAAVYHVESDELWLGGRDTPTTCNGVPVRVTDGRPLAEVSVASYLHPTTLPDDGMRLPLLRVLQAAATVRMLGSGSVELAFLAGGRLGGWVHYDTLDWDWLPGVALVRAAGGVTHVTEVGGHRWHIAGSRQVADEITALLESR
jgi:myo-inositol-1(or 4)-monophosphatase